MSKPALSAAAAAGDDSPFHEITGSRAFEEVIDQITFAIRAGRYRPGERLPTMAHLAQALHVSKPTVGIAIKALGDAGVVRADRGAMGGITVVTADVPVTLMRLSTGWRSPALRELLEARRPIEMQIALLAGARATASDLTTLRGGVDELARLAPGGDRLSILRADHLFHYALGQAARSEMLAYYQHQILEYLAKALDDYEDQYQDIASVLETHRQTLAAIESRDPERIRDAMEVHLGGLERSASAHA
jgi:GntR family transcriptional repressor for pyruvate dehydrogenase complex